MICKWDRRKVFLDFLRRINKFSYIFVTSFARATTVCYRFFNYAIVKIAIHANSILSLKGNILLLIAINIMKARIKKKLTHRKSKWTCSTSFPFKFPGNAKRKKGKHSRKKSLAQVTQRSIELSFTLRLLPSDIGVFVVGVRSTQFLRRKKFFMKLSSEEK